MPAALAELIPELGLALILFAAVASYLAARGCLGIWRHTFGAMLLFIGSWLNWSVTVFGRHIGFDFGKVFVAVDKHVRNWLEAWVSGSEEGMARTLRAMRAVALAGVRATEWLARETALTFDWLTRVHLPRWAKVALAPALLPLLLPRLLRYVLAHVKTVIVKPVKVIERTLPGKVVTIIRHAGAVAIPGALGIPLIWREIYGLTKRNLRLAKRLRNVEALLGVTGMALAMANVLGLPNWRCLTRGNIGKTARRLCGLPTHVLDDLLGLLADFYVLQHICDLLSLMEDGLALIQPEVQTVIDGMADTFVHCGYQLSPEASPAFVSLPPVTGLTISLP